MKQLAIERLRAAVVTQVQTHDIEAAPEQFGPSRLHVQRVRSAFPAVQQHGRAPRAGAFWALL